MLRYKISVYEFIAFVHLLKICCLAAGEDVRPITREERLNLRYLFIVEKL